MRRSAGSRVLPACALIDIVPIGAHLRFVYLDPAVRRLYSSTCSRPWRRVTVGDKTIPDGGRRATVVEGATVGAAIFRDGPEHRLGRRLATRSEDRRDLKGAE